MPTPPIDEVAYEAWVIRRADDGKLRVMYAAVASGPREVLVPLPWPEARIDAASPVGEGKAGWAAVWTLWFAVLPWRKHTMGLESSGLFGGTPIEPAGSVRMAGERVAGSLRADEVGPLRSLPDSWQRAQRYLRWPALKGWAAFATRFRCRQLAPVALVVEDAPGPTIYSTAKAADIFLIDRERLDDLPAEWRTDLLHGTGFEVPGLLEPGEHLHWLRRSSAFPHLYEYRFQRFEDAWAGLKKEAVPRQSFGPNSAEYPVGSPRACG